MQNTKNQEIGGDYYWFFSVSVTVFVQVILNFVSRKTLHDSYKAVQLARNIICPNVGFFQQLIDLEQKVFTTTTCSNVQLMSSLHFFHSLKPVTLSPVFYWIEFPNGTIYHLFSGCRIPARTKSPATNLFGIKK